jgi:hypothetical protein
MKSEQLRNQPLHVITDTIGFQYLFFGPESIFKAIQRKKLMMTTKGKEARWTSPEDSLCDWMLGLEDEEYALILSFVYKCANCTRKQQPKMCWQTYLGVNEIEMRLC